MEITGLVDSVSPSKSGKALRVKIGSEYYNAYLDSGIQQGTVITATYEDSQYGKGIKTWKAAPNAPQTPPAASTGSDKGVLPNNCVAPWWTSFASNQCAHLIAAGVITTPEQMKTWTGAVVDAIIAAERDSIAF